MRMRNEITGDVLEFPPPDFSGKTTVSVNGKVVFRVECSDFAPRMTLDDGRAFTPEEFADFLVQYLHSNKEFA